ncbi:glycerol kinase [Devosia geojensis]|uniref:ATP:glycerol 3-phosphotransferase n=1 Tax=Devosia geojensis TaxID=443610 RepID=A0A0F5FDU9_9HYPH|nr:FGGY-family carbohydrate kinase [Devosia geojensis]KKB07069.1 glycerol kinase [Devosia geojensis]
MTAPLVLAIDQGTTNTKALLVSPDGRIVAQASVPNAVDYPRPGWAEQSGEKLWQGVRAAIEAAVGRAGGAEEIVALAISNQRESVLVWDAATGEPIGPCIIWQCRRTAEVCAQLQAAGHADLIAVRTGLGLDPLFPAAKIAWLIDAVPGARQRAERGELRAGTVDTWLLWKLTDGALHATDHSNASRTQLFDIGRLAWDAELAELFRVPMPLLAQVHPSNTRFGKVAAGTTALPAGIPIHAMIGDSHAALYGHGVRSPGTVKATYGTGTSLMTLTPGKVRSRHGLSATIAWSTPAGAVHALEGNISVSGQAAQFMAELLGLTDANAVATLAQTAIDTQGVTFVPALVGLGAPHWRSDARGTITGMSLTTKPAHFARAALEAIAFQVADVFTAMEKDLGAELAGLSADGGASQNAMLMQFQADLLDRPVTASAAPEVSALGAAALAFDGLGIATQFSDGGTRFSPAIDPAARAAHLERWQAAVRQTLTT